MIFFPDYKQTQAICVMFTLVQTFPFIDWGYGIKLLKQKAKMLTLLSFNDEYSVGTQLRDLFIIDVNSIGTEEVLERLSPLLEDRYLDKVVCYQLIFYL